ncbi:hypothetical protein DFA_02964 [Cavenderia fasciculata]|uniref:Sugar phosphate transporter domain-containing protein n=1 Tax=Cavenderia fasciculata TaxID=261658 RepID=F4PG86_CACFS|nr:uncharacterized protein DFA_02964 [Cavenderia fasciculata]EGG24720.1 hypothetical protein DFA_02964 [Cavenderia fasciculata]|eukprot:XP_004362571.1 hypothetical protein DFA_02964 [Cavenderia fasciculata]
MVPNNNSQEKELSISIDSGSSLNNSIGLNNNNNNNVKEKEIVSIYDIIDKNKGFLVALGYGVTSVSITFFNKAVLNYYGFNYSNALTLGQMVFSLFFLHFLKLFKYINYPDLDYNLCKKLFSLSTLFILMVVSGLAALAKTNVPLFSALRRLSTLIVIAGEKVLLGKVTPANEIQSVVLMVVGAMIAGWGDVTFDFVGSLYILFNCFVTAGYLIYIAKKSQETGLNTFGLMFYCNILSLPATILLTLLTEGKGLLTFEGYSNLGFQFCFLMSSVQAFLLNYFIFLCSTYNSPLTTSITGQIKSVLQTVIGLFMFNDVVLSLLLIYGLLLSTAASFWYTFIKYSQTLNKQRSQNK